MRKDVVLGLCALALGSADLAALEIQVGSATAVYGLYQAGEGGEFTLVPTVGPLDLSGYSAQTKNIGVAGSFQTFCLEHSEYIYPYPTTYTIEINTAAMNGGLGAVNGKDTISKATGWLYSEFAKGTLAGYNYNGGEALRESSALVLQNAIWMLEDERPLDLNNYYLNLIVGPGKLFATIDLAKADGADAYGVYALNMWKNDNRQQGQDQLYFNPVPDAASTGALLACATLSLAFAARRQR